MNFLLGWPIFRGYVSFRECKTLAKGILFLGVRGWSFGRSRSLEKICIFFMDASIKLLVLYCGLGFPWFFFGVSHYLVVFFSPGNQKGVHQEFPQRLGRGRLGFSHMAPAGHLLKVHPLWVGVNHHGNLRVPPVPMPRLPPGNSRPY